MYKISGSVNQYTDLELALMVLMNVFGTGTNRRKILGDRFTAVQNIVNVITMTNRIPVGKGTVSDEKIRKVFKKFEPTSEEYTEFINEFLNALKEEK